MATEGLKKYQDFLFDQFMRGESRVVLITHLDLFDLKNGEKESLEKYITELPEYEPDFTDPNYKSLTDMGNAERLIELYGDMIKYNYESGKWLIYSKKCWIWDNGDNIKEMAKLAARNIYHEAGDTDDEKYRNELAKHAKQSENNIRIKGMIELAQSAVPILIKQLNRDQFLLNVNNGTINLKTGELREHRASDLITFIIPIDYDENAKSELWESFLNRIFEGNGDLINYIQKSFGYSITGNQDEQALWFFYGSGANGKTTLTGVIRDILGEYAIEIDPLAFAVDKNARTGPNEAIASLYNKRFAAATEIKTGVTLDVALVKRMTGGEQLRCERKFEHGFNFTPTHKLFLSGNHEPRITDTTNSIWNRLKYVPFNVSIPENERIKGLRYTLSREHGPAILNWLVQGCLKWQSEGLMEPPEVKAAIQTYRDSQDILHDFLQERCLIQPGETITVKELYSEYKNWAENNDIDKPLSKRVFGDRLREKNLKVHPGTGNVQIWYGIRLLTTEEKVNQVNQVNKNLESSQENYSRTETFEKKVNSLNLLNSVNSLDYPSENCSVCGKDAWGLKPDGKTYYCTECEDKNGNYE